ncbi:MAG: GNAT family N-acetyltransferase [Bacilli bacterium]|nr:GNAT family N-acetyltransferase [Bacilli bacterium]
MIGLVQIHSKDQLNQKCKLGYILGYKYCINGYMKELLTKVIDFAFHKLSYHKIESEIVSENKDSIGLVKSLGMKYEGTKIDDYKLGDEYYNQEVYYLINPNF